MNTLIVKICFLSFGVITDTQVLLYKVFFFVTFHVSVHSQFIIKLQLYLLMFLREWSKVFLIFSATPEVR